MYVSLLPVCLCTGTGLDFKEKEPAAPGTWWCFRNTVTLDEQPRSLELRLAADTKYWLWVNDELQVSEGGLKRGRTLWTPIAM